MSCCGILCDECGAFIATRDDDDERRAKVAEQWSKMYDHPFTAADINCTGCHSSGVHIGHWDVCEVRVCVMERGLDNCGACDDYACEKVEVILKMAPGNRKRLDEVREGK